MPSSAPRFAPLVLLLLLAAPPPTVYSDGVAEEPTLARLSFWLLPERMDEFAVAYRRQVLPVLTGLGLEPSSREGRATVDSVFSRLFAARHPGHVADLAGHLWWDPAWKALLQELGATYGRGGLDGALRYRFGLYSAPAGPGRSVAAGAGTRQGLWLTYSVHDGLPSNTTSVSQDSSGHIWFGSHGQGACRYDGTRFTTLSAADGLDGYDLVPITMADGTMWFVTDVVATRYRDGVFEAFREEDGLPRGHASGLAEDEDGVLWLGKTWGVSRYDGETFTTFTREDGLPGGEVRAVFPGPDGQMWFATQGGVCRFDGQSISPVLTADVSARSLISACRVDREGGLWVGSRLGVSRHDGERSELVLALDSDEYGEVSAILEDREGNMWFGASSGGVSRHDGQQISRFTQENGLAGNQIWGILEDRQGFLWFATVSGGVSRYDGVQLTHFTPRDGLTSSSVYGAFEDSEGDLWFGVHGGVHRFDGKEFTAYPEAGHRAGAILEDSKGNLWFGSEGYGRERLTRYDGESFDTFTTDDGLVSAGVFVMYEDRAGDIWICTKAGVSRYDGREFHTFDIGDVLPRPTDDVWRERIIGIAEDRNGDLWFASMIGLVRYDGREFHAFRPREGHLTGFIGDLLADRDGNLWITSMEGVHLYDGDRLVLFTTADGLPPGWVGPVTEDASGHLWFGLTGGGVVRFDGEVFQSLSRRDGMLDDLVRQIIQDRHGDMWITSAGGITRYRPLDTPPVVRLRQVIADRAYPGDEDVAIPSTQDLVTFSFQGRSMTTPPDRMVYVYRLEGHDQEWRQTRVGEVAYTELAEGAYTFQVKAVDRDLNYSEPARVELEVYHQPLSSSVQVSDLTVQDVFASFHKTYAEQSIGSVVVANDDADSVEVTVSFYIPDLMRRPSEQKVDMAPHSSRTMALRAVLDESMLELEGSTSAEAEVSLSCEVGEQTISVSEKQSITIHGRGALTWDTLGRAAAFVTPEDDGVAGFARALYEAFRSRLRRGKVDGAIPTAMLLFDALDAHGIKYAADSSTPYAQARGDRSAVDHIQYPAELLASRMGDCDDCTVLYCSLLENLSIPTALVEAPGHVFMMFDSGVTAKRDLGFSMDDSWYVERDGHFWIPVEVTKLGEGSFMEAWELGAKTCARLADAGDLRITDVQEAWFEYPYALPPGSAAVEPPDSEQLERAFRADLDALRRVREKHVQQEYIRPLLRNPDNHGLRLDLARVRIESEDYNGGISVLMGLLETELRAEAQFLIGYAYVGLDDFETAIRHMGEAVEVDPDNVIYASRLEMLRKAVEGR